MPDPTPAWLDTQGLQAQLLGRDSTTAGDAASAARRYADLIGSELDLQLWAGALQQQIYLGDDEFISRMQALASPQAAAAVEVPRVQRRAPGGIRRASEAMGQQEERSLARWRACREEGVTMTALAARCGLSVSRVSRLIAGVGAKGGNRQDLINI